MTAVQFNTDVILVQNTTSGTMTTAEEFDVQKRSWNLPVVVGATGLIVLTLMANASTPYAVSTGSRRESRSAVLAPYADHLNARLGYTAAQAGAPVTILTPEEYTGEQEVREVDLKRLNALHDRLVTGGLFTSLGMVLFSLVGLFARLVPSDIAWTVAALGIVSAMGIGGIRVLYWAVFMR